MHADVCGSEDNKSEEGIATDDDGDDLSWIICP
jgi:hypothetical protein